jgi:hypothetical protein
MRSSLYFLPSQGSEHSGLFQNEIQNPGKSADAHLNCFVTNFIGNDLALGISVRDQP